MEEIVTYIGRKELARKIALYELYGVQETLGRAQDNTGQADDELATVAEKRAAADRIPADLADFFPEKTKMLSLSFKLQQLSQVPHLMEILGGFVGCLVAELDLSVNDIETADIDNLSHLERLHDSLLFLDVTHNALRDLDAVRAARNLRRIDASHNVLTHISGAARLHQLRYLDVSRNCINVSPDMTHCTALRTLILDHNPDLTLFSVPPSLQSISFVATGVSDLTAVAVALASCTKLQSIGLADTPLNEVDGAKVRLLEATGVTWMDGERISRVQSQLLFREYNRENLKSVVQEANLLFYNIIDEQKGQRDIRIDRLREQIEEIEQDFEDYRGEMEKLLTTLTVDMEILTDKDILTDRQRLRAVITAAKGKARSLKPKYG